MSRTGWRKLKRNCRVTDYIRRDKIYNDFEGTSSSGVEHYLKGRVHCFSMQVVMNKCFLLKPEKNLAQIRLVVYEKNEKRTFKSEK